MTYVILGLMNPMLSNWVGPTLSGNFQRCWGMLPTETAGEQYIAINSTLYTLILKLLTMW